jgi:hypothetical protein
MAVLDGLFWGPSENCLAWRRELISLIVQGVPAEVFNIGRSAMPRAELIALRSVIRLIEWLLQVDFTSVKKIYESYRDLNHR